MLALCFIVSRLGCSFNSRLGAIASDDDGSFNYRIRINKKRANFEDAFCGRMTNTTMNRRARYEITAGDFASPFTLLDLSFEFVGAAAVTIEIMYANALLIYAVSV